jgi:hypothetical protein
MKKFLSLITLLLLAFTMQAQLVKQPFVNYNVGTVATTVPGVQSKLTNVVPFMNTYTGNQWGSWAVVQIDYTAMTGDSCKVRIYSSANQTFTGITTALNAASVVKGAATSTAWKTGQAYGTVVTKYEMINLSNYPTGFLKFVIDTTTGITTGKVTVTVKPYFHYTPTWKESLIKYPIVNYAITTKSIKSIVIPFYPDKVVKSVVMQVDWLGMAGNAVNVKLYASGTQTFTDTTRINSTTAVKWTTGANVTKWDTINLQTFPVQYLKILIDTCTGANTSGTVNVSLKPIFK